MTLAPGTKLGPYEILSALGAGGMGEVYKAKDARLDRFVAIKVLPEHLAKHPESLARFEREAKAVAALNHPNITGIFDLGREGEAVYAVMELLEGQTLRAKLQEGPLSPRKATELAIQMAQGLAAAHAKGVIHRDLKPDNLWLTTDGRLKILDFGLAKQLLPQGPSSNSFLPTEAMSPGHATEQGMILGTMGYMSPEQVRGEAVDARSDLFSFGTVLFEMLTGKRAFGRDSAADTMAAILREEPTLPDASSGRAIPSGLQRILDHCLEKAPARRFHDAQDLAFALESSTGDSGAPVATPAIPPPPAAPARWPLLAAGLGGALLATLGVGLLRRPAAPVNLPVAVRFLTYSGRDSSPAASPDGRTVAFTSNRDGQSRIWLKQLKGGGEVALSPGSDDYPRFSPDGSSLLFIRAEGPKTSLFRMSLLGTDIRRVVEDAATADWSPDGSLIAFIRIKAGSGTFESSLRVIDAAGGSERELAHFDGDFLASPRWNPDGSAIALTTGFGTAGGSIQKIFRVPVKGGAPQEFQGALKFGAISSCAWVGLDEVIYFQPESVTGNGVGTSPARAYRHNLRTGATQALFWAPASSSGVDLLPDGRVVFDSVSGRQTLREYPMEGKGTPRWLTRGTIGDRQPTFAPDGKRLLFSSNRSGNLDLWELATDTGMVRSLTDDAAEDWDPAYTPDGTHLLFSSNRSGAFEIWTANADGSGAHQLTRDGVDAENPTQTRDGKWVVYVSANPQYPGLWKIHPDGTGATQLLKGTNFALPDVSPDGQYVVFQTVLSPTSTLLHAIRVDDGREVFQTHVAGTRKTIVTIGRCRWTPDGRRLLFTGQNPQGLDGVFIQDFIPGKDTTATRRPVAGFDPEWLTESLGLSPDGKRLVLSESERLFSLMVAEGVQGLGRKGAR
ncbi:MAG TPA: protein kinase [Holophagaceae bacterium]|nr:protein kinase [Holophagaceae bacterium]